MKKISEEKAYKLYDQWLVDIYGDTVTIFGLEYDALRLFKEHDETGYQCGFNDWLDSEGLELGEEEEEEEE